MTYAFLCVLTRKDMFCCAESTTVKGASVPLLPLYASVGVCVCPSRPPPMPPDRRPRGWSTGKPTLKFNSDLKIVMS